MRELNTIQKREKLNTIYATDEKGNGGANHEYHIVAEAEEDAAYDVRITKFRKGPRKIKINILEGIKVIVRDDKDKLVFQNLDFEIMFWNNVRWFVTVFSKSPEVTIRNSKR